jgi:23S rRNA (cytosine1962-C5)-methyltransferase
MQTLHLLKKQEKRLLQGHLWIFSNEVNVSKSPLKGFEQGEQVFVAANSGRIIGVAIVNPKMLIVARIISFDQKHRLERSFIAKKLKLALSLRERFFKEPFYRLVYGDSDGLPGLVIDRFGDYYVVQISSAGFELVIEEIIQALINTLSPKGVLLKNDGKMRESEGLEIYTKVIYGEVPDFCEIEENNTKFIVPVKDGQKTGWFFDHRESRAFLNQYVADQKVLDVFSYAGGWGVQAAVSGAKHVTCIDASKKALECVEKNAALNNCESKVAVELGNAFDVLKAMQLEKKTFDVIIIDPPAFMTRKKDRTEALVAYQRINYMALGLLSPGGLLMSASCSLHLSRRELISCVQKAARKSKKVVQAVYQGGQASDHPVHPAIPETDYLKAVLFREVS